MARNCCKYFTVSLVPIAALTLAILFGSGIVILPVLYEELGQKMRYGIIIDAGSAHTDFFIYQWSIKDTSTSTTADNVTQLYHCYTDRALSNYTSDPQQAGDAFSGCLDDSYREKIVPKSEWKHTQIFLGATAGMRLVREKNQTVSNEIMDSVRETLNHSKYLFEDETKHAQIISGTTEAASGWVTTNKADRNFQPPKPLNQTLGSIDLGGASVEIAFIPPNNVTVKPSYNTTERLYNKPYNIYARSLLCYGHNEALRRFLAHLALKASNVNQVPNPCLFDGANYTDTFQNIMNGSVCVRNATEPQASVRFPSPADRERDITYVGKWNKTQCQQAITEVFNYSACIFSSTCIGEEYFYPPLTRDFMGFSGFYYTARFFQFDNIPLNATNLTAPFDTNVTDVCNLTYSKAHQRNPGDKFLKQHCFDAYYMEHLLLAGFGMNHSNWSGTVMFVDRVHGISVGWAMGYLLAMTAHIGPKPYYIDRPYSAVDLVVGVIVLSILCFVFIIFFFLTFYACRKVVRTRSGYTDIA